VFNQTRSSNGPNWAAAAAIPDGMACSVMLAVSI
jgi:hypothetical protein